MASVDSTSRYSLDDLSRPSGDPQISSAQMLRRHAQDLIETAERLLAQAEAELETAYAMVSAAAGRSRAAMTR